MATTSMVTLREKTSHELVDQLMVEKKRLFDGIVKGASGETIKPHEKRDGRRLIARIECLLRERTLRKELDAEIAKLTPKSQGATPRFARTSSSRYSIPRTSARSQTTKPSCEPAAEPTSPFWRATITGWRATSWAGKSPFLRRIPAIA